MPDVPDMTIDDAGVVVPDSLKEEMSRDVLRQLIDRMMAERQLPVLILSVGFDPRNRPGMWPAVPGITTEHLVALLEKNLEALREGNTIDTEVKLEPRGAAYGQ